MSRLLLKTRDLSCHYNVRTPGRVFAKKQVLKAVDGISISLAFGRTLGLVGESGCGKSTTAKLVLGIIPRTAGSIWFDGASVEARQDQSWRKMRQQAQLVHQDPLAALDRRLTVGYQVAEPLLVQGHGDGRTRRQSMLEMLNAVGLSSQVAARYPHELSGGQRQRVVLARALILKPKLVVCDEPISALDVSIQAQVINLLLDMREQIGLSYLFISHDLKIVRHICDEIAVMYLGRIVEKGPTETIIRTPAHPYTQALISAIPSAAKRGGSARIILEGDPPSPIDVPTGCPFHPRCRWAREECRVKRPELRPLESGRDVACHLAETTSRVEAR